MQGKILEIRDRGTRIDVMAVRPADHFTHIHEWPYFLRHGFLPNSDIVIVTRIENQVTKAYPDDWDSPRTMGTAHVYITNHWKELKTCDVVDVEYILGETDTPKRPEREEWE